jgi:hypothetical protein
VVLAGPVLGLLAGSTVNTTGTIVDLLIVVGVPLVVGLALRRAAARVPFVAAAIDPASILVVLVLVALVGSEIHPSAEYVVVTAAIVAFVVAMTGASLLIARLVVPASRPAVVLTVAVRDFAVASAIAGAAFGPRASGPLGIYGVVVIATGAALVRYLKPAARRD